MEDESVYIISERGDVYESHLVFYSKNILIDLLIATTINLKTKISRKL